MASGLPVVLIAEGEPADIVKMAKCGYVVRPDNIEGIAKAVESLAKNKELSKIMAETGRNSVIKSYDRNNILNDFMTFIEMNQKDL
jgi:glycosyltransferase involved in cell wall biosynthesis